MKKRYIISFVVAIIILSVMFLWNVGAGSVDISTSDLFAILAGSGKDETFSQIVWKIRLPRILAGYDDGQCAGCGRQCDYPVSAELPVNQRS